MHSVQRIPKPVIQTNKIRTILASTVAKIFSFFFLFFHMNQKFFPLSLIATVQHIHVCIIVNFA